MKTPRLTSSLPIHDYSSARENALSWLGERHLLAVPLNVRQPHRAPPAWLLQTTPWLQTAPRGR